MIAPAPRIIADLADVSAAQWDALAAGDPFLSHAYLYALQMSGCTTPAFGWQAQHLALWQGERLVGAMPLYVKMNSYGEHVFDFAWADAYQRNGLRYYPKLVCTVPFAPVTGARLLGATAEIRAMLLREALRLAKECVVEHSASTPTLTLPDGTASHSAKPADGQVAGYPHGEGNEDRGVSSLHCLFLNEADAQLAREAGMMLRQDVQFHWRNDGYRDFEDFLAALSRDKRKRIRQDRRHVRDAGIALQCVTGDAATEEQWAFFASCYAHTRVTHHSPPALNDDFFMRLGAALPQHTLLVIASRGGKMIASALNIVTDDVLYGRSWGAFEFHSGLHFEACFYQAIEFCIARGIKTFEGGAGGEHKLARGFLPVTTCSAHWLAHPELSRAVEAYLRRETDAVEDYVEELQGHSPFKRG